MEKYIQDWINLDPDPTTKAYLQQLLDKKQTEQLEHIFSGRLQFGTAGIRGVVGAGPTQMNRLVIQQTTVGIAHYIKRCFPDDLKAGIIIGFDSRTDSKQFAMDAAEVLCAHDIHVHFIDFYTPTPLIPFGVVQLKCLAGIMITASHNPPQYNGYKFYWQDGAQINTEHITQIQSLIEQQAAFPAPKIEFEKAQKQNRLSLLDHSFFQSYKQHIMLSPFLKHAQLPDNISLAYTALHGVGTEMTQALLHDLDVKSCYYVTTQCEPDGTFPTLSNPNPENAESFTEVIKTAKEKDCLLAIAHDPDADRFRVAAQTEHHEYQILTGDQIGCLIADHLLSQQHKKQQMVGTTIVSSSMLEKIAKQYKANFYKTLTGFKWLAQHAMDQQNHKVQFLFAYEEALGYMFGHQIWDKDGLCALAVFLDLCASLDDKKQSIWQKLEQMYRKHDLHMHQQATLPLDAQSKDLIHQLRALEHYDLEDDPLVSYQDLQDDPLFTCDALIFQYEHVRVILRMSGTEPKIKCYYEWAQPIHEKIHFLSMQDITAKKLNAFVEKHQAFLKSIGN